MVLKQMGNGCNTVIQTSGFDKGFYFVELKIETGKVYRSKFIVK